jgi:hypothetical protein
MGTGRTGRAIAALSRILCGDINASSDMGIAWALLGLEALYADGNQGLSQQILRKSEILLGPRNPKNHGSREYMTTVLGFCMGASIYRSRIRLSDSIRLIKASSCTTLTNIGALRLAC